MENKRGKFFEKFLFAGILMIFHTILKRNNYSIWFLANFDV